MTGGNFCQIIIPATFRDVSLAARELAVESRWEREGLRKVDVL
jgi:hypothetical protein